MIKGEHLVGEVANEQTLPSLVAVITGVDPHGSACHTSLRVGNPGKHPYVGERTIFVVAKEIVGLCVVGNGEVEPAIIVVVADGDTETFTLG